MNTIEHKGYIGVVEFCADDECYFATVEGMRDLLMTESEDAKSLKINFQRIVDEYLIECAESGREPAQQASGHFQVRIAPILHTKIKAIAKNKSQPMNDLVSEALHAFVD